MVDKRFNHSKRTIYDNGEVPHHFSLKELQPPALDSYSYLREQKEEAGLQGPTGHRHLHYTYNISITVS